MTVIFLVHFNNHYIVVVVVVVLVVVVVYVFVNFVLFIVKTNVSINERMRMHILGSGAGGKLGLGDQKDRPNPCLIPRLKGRSVT